MAEIYIDPDFKITDELLKVHGITDSEYADIKNHLKREPTLTELGMFSVLWSEHCSYKSSKKYFKYFPTKGKYVVQGPGENAGIVDIGDGIRIAMKIESHNHPSAVEPHQGAATGVGGIIRDIFTMGARPVALMDSLRFGRRKSNRTKWIEEGVVSGISAYGNCVGVPTVGGEVYYDDCYEGNPLVNAMCVGVINNTCTVKAVAAGVGNPVIYAGSATGRDGLGGAAFASRELSEVSHADRPAVQVGDPFAEKSLIEACLEIAQKDYLIGMQDMGAAGLTSSSAEMADRAGQGIFLDLDKVPTRSDDLVPYEYMLSESQERMLLVVKNGFEEQAIKIFEHWEVPAAVAGEVTEKQNLTVSFNKQIYADVPVDSLTSKAPQYDRPTRKRNRSFINLKAQPKLDSAEQIEFWSDKLKNDGCIRLKKDIYEQNDYQEQTNTITKPGEADAAVIWLKDTKRAIAITTDGNGRWCDSDPEIGAKWIMAEAYLNICCVGANPIAITDGLNFGSAEDPEVMGDFESVCKGIGVACDIFETPVISGNVSFYNEYKGSSIYPTPIIGMLGIIDDLAKTSKLAFTKSDCPIYLLGVPATQIWGSLFEEYALERRSQKLVDIDLYQVRALGQFVIKLIKEQIIQNAHDVSDGGLLLAVTEACEAGSLGAELTIEHDIADKASLFFGEYPAAVIASIRSDDKQIFEQRCKENNINYLHLGYTNNMAGRISFS